MHKVYIYNNKQIDQTAPPKKLGCNGYGRRRRRSLRDVMQLAFRRGRQRRSTEAGQRDCGHKSTQPNTGIKKEGKNLLGGFALRRWRKVTDLQLDMHKERLLHLCISSEEAKVTGSKRDSNNRYWEVSVRATCKVSVQIKPLGSTKNLIFSIWSGLGSWGTAEETPWRPYRKHLWTTEQLKPQWSSEVSPKTDIGNQNAALRISLKWTQ